jgi:formylglycine-generating enzyme required for sulfatase activity
VDEWEFAAMFGLPADYFESEQLDSGDRVFWNKMRGDDPRGIAEGEAYPLGFKNLSGNVWELTLSRNGDVVAQGGSYLSETRQEITPSHTRTVDDVINTLRHQAIGFRLVFEVPYVDFENRTLNGGSNE